ncbi:MAG TPA: ABC transporter substrate-binding protein [Thermomicrobiales bacterium]|jgi:peptide/nickel transport system substrate-binding protein
MAPFKRQHESQDADKNEQLSQRWTARGLSRRDFLRLSGAGVSAATLTALLAACGSEAAPTAAPAASTAPSAAPSTAASAAPSAAASAAPSTAASAAPGGAVSTVTRTAGTAAAGTAAAGAGGATSLPSGGKYSTIQPVGKKGGRIIEGNVTEVKTFNGMVSSDTSSAAMIAMVFNQLLGLNPDTALPFPDLATEVPTRENGGISQDGLTYTFKLRTDVKWHDGTPFTAKDVVYTYTTMQKKELGSQRTTELNDRVESITAQGDNTVVFKMKKIVAPFLTSNMYAIVPEHILKDVPADQIKAHPFSLGDAKATIGTGPFKFGSYTKGDNVTLVKNPGYFRGEPAIDQYILKVVKDGTVLAAQLKTGEVDFGEITAALYEDMTKQPNVNAVKYDTYNFNFYTYQLDTAKTDLFQEKAVRQALAYALDREAMLKAIQFGLGSSGAGTEPVLSWAYAPDQITTKYTYDPNKANQLLDGAGWVKGPDGIRAKNGKKLSFTIWGQSGSPVIDGYMASMQQLWKAIGVDCTPKNEEFSSLVARLTETYDFEMVIVGFSWGVDPDQSTMWATESYKGGFNLNKYSNPQVDTIVKQALSELDQEKRKQLYIQMQNIVADEAPSVILYFRQIPAAVNKRVHNLFPNAVSIRWNAHTWWVD